MARATNSDRTETPNRFPWPPALFVSLAVLAGVLSWIAPVGLTLPGWAEAFGGVLALAAIGLVLWAIVTMRRAHTNIHPNRAADHLVAHGVFAFSRNPMYVANVALLAGIGLAASAPWFWAAAALDAILLTEFAIRREEAHMAARFGEAWTDYRRRVPRWIGPL